jgi:predicted nucleic acid-binding protein
MILVDTNILIDIISGNSPFAKTSAALLERIGEFHELAINPIIYAELSVGFNKIETLEAAFPRDLFRRLELPWSAGFLAGKAYLQYRKKQGAKISPLPDFYIGAHAAVEELGLATRDISRYHTYFPTVELFIPEKSV